MTTEWFEDACLARFILPACLTVALFQTQAPFSRDERLGWLTFCPSNLGTTVRASVHIRLPKISSKPEFKKIADDLGLQIRGIHGEHSESEGGVYDISNKARLGLTEFEAVKQVILITTFQALRSNERFRCMTESST